MLLLSNQYISICFLVNIARCGRDLCSAYMEDLPTLEAWILCDTFIFYYIGYACLLLFYINKRLSGLQILCSILTGAMSYLHNVFYDSLVETELPIESKLNLQIAYISYVCLVWYTIWSRNYEDISFPDDVSPTHFRKCLSATAHKCVSCDILSSFLFWLYERFLRYLDEISPESVCIIKMAICMYLLSVVLFSIHRERAFHESDEWNYDNTLSRLCLTQITLDLFSAVYFTIFSWSRLNEYLEIYSVANIFFCLNIMAISYNGSIPTFMRWWMKYTFSCKSLYILCLTCVNIREAHHEFDPSSSSPFFQENMIDKFCLGIFVWALNLQCLFDAIYDDWNVWRPVIINLNQSGRGDEESCSICWSEYVNGEAVLLKCNHIFHEECIIMWIRRSRTQTCPYCRRSIVS